MYSRDSPEHKSAFKNRIAPRLQKLPYPLFHMPTLSCQPPLKKNATSVQFPLWTLHRLCRMPLYLLQQEAMRSNKKGLSQVSLYEAGLNWWRVGVTFDVVALATWGVQHSNKTVRMYYHTSFQPSNNANCVSYNSIYTFPQHSCYSLIPRPISISAFCASHRRRP